MMIHKDNVKRKFKEQPEIITPFYLIISKFRKFLKNIRLIRTKIVTVD